MSHRRAKKVRKLLKRAGVDVSAPVQYQEQNILVRKLMKLINGNTVEYRYLGTRKLKEGHPRKVYKIIKKVVKNYGYPTPKLDKQSES